jgi:cyclophilin family peptidyl-prolyl cis-trans isomerase/HEAT repeat protein
MPLSSSRALNCLTFATLLCAPAGLRAQDGASVEALAPVLAAEDARQWNDAVLRRGVTFADTVVRSRTAMAIGRIGDLQGIPLLLMLLDDGEANVRPSAAFALGLLRDTVAVAPLIRSLTVLPGADIATTREIITALARIGGREASEFFADALSGRAPLVTPDTMLALRHFAFESWRLGADAPIAALVPYVSDTSADARWRAIYSVSRLRRAARPAGGAVSAALSDKLPLARSMAARALTRTWADSAGLDRKAMAGLLARALTDDDAAVRINALRSLATYQLPSYSEQVSRLLNDPMPNVAIEAVTTLGALGGPVAVAALEQTLDARKGYAMRREALLALARADSTATRKALPPFATANDWRERAIAAEAVAIAFPDNGVQAFLLDNDPKVVAAALLAWNANAPADDTSLVAQARPLLTSRDFMVRAGAAQVLARAARPADVPALVVMFRRAQADSATDGAIAALDALLAISTASDAGHAQVQADFQKAFPRQPNYELRAWAEDNWPELASSWGPMAPIQTGRNPQDYRDIVRRFMLPLSPDRRPHVFIEVDQKGIIELELFASEAPLTVANYLRLVNSRYFDRLRFHRVVPNFMAQDGDPRGDGNGGPGYAIRDEINMNRYMTAMIGMAHSGPDTGGSQWFINLSPQPHLDGAYTVFGKVVNGGGTLQHVVMGDVIRSVHQ